MVEYLYNAIRATAGQDIPVVAIITDENNAVVSEGCGLMLHDNETMIVKIDGAFDGEQWIFNIPANVTEGRHGRYWYCICHHDMNLCFKQPIYLV